MKKMNAKVNWKQCKVCLAGYDAEYQDCPHCEAVKNLDV